MRLTFKELKDEVQKIVPKEIPYTVELEAGNIAIVTPEPNRILGYRWLYLQRSLTK